MKRIIFTILFMLVICSLLLTAQTIVYDYDDAGNRIRRNIDCDGEPKVEIVAPNTEFCEGGNITLEASPGFQSYKWNGVAGESQLTVSIGGMYSIEAIDNFGCISTDEINIIAHPLPVVDLGGPKIWIPKNTSYTLSTAGSFVSYLWSTDETTSTIILESKRYKKETNISLDVLDANGCAGYGEVLVQKGDAPLLAINDIFAESDLNTSSENAEEGNTEKITEELNFKEYKIYPNPNNGKFYIDLPIPELVKQVDIFDFRGNHIKTIIVVR
jgi:hypothetical protein